MQLGYIFNRYLAVRLMAQQVTKVFSEHLTETIVISQANAKNINEIFFFKEMNTKAIDFFYQLNQVCLKKH
mgnify:CR=1 FL=1